MKMTEVLGACVVFTLCVAGAAWPAQTGGLAAPVEGGGLALSATLAYSERDVKNGRDDQVSSRRMLVRAAFGLVDGLDLYLTLGFSDANFDKLDFEGTLGPSVGGGLRYRLMNFPESALQLVLDLQGEYFRSQDGSKDLDHQAYHLATYVVKKIGAAGRVGYFYPYGGVRVSYARYDTNEGIDDTEGKDVVGVFGGTDYFVNPNVYFSGELHLFDETGIYLGVGYRF
jgi:hypothetical protein